MNARTWKNGFGERLVYMRGTILSGPLKGKKVYLTLTNRELYSTDTEDDSLVAVFEDNNGEMLMHEVSPSDIGEMEEEDSCR